MSQFKIPKQVAHKHLKENGKLFSTEHIQKITDYFSENKGVQRLSKKKTAELLGISLLQEDADKPKDDGQSFTLLKFNEGVFAVYTPGKEILGKGGMGRVKLMQNLETGEWLALKIMDENPVLSAAEVDNLRKLNLKHETMLDKHNSAKDSRIFLATDFIQGKSVEKYSFLGGADKVSPTTTLAKLDLAQGMISSIKYVHDHGLYHCDIKPANFMYDEETRKVSAIDFGGSISVDQPLRKLGDGVTRSYLAPEAIFTAVLGNEQFRAEKHALVTEEKRLQDLIRLTSNPGEKETILSQIREINKKITALNKRMAIFSYTKQADIYALGLSVGEVLNLTEFAPGEKVLQLDRKELFPNESDNVAFSITDSSGGYNNLLAIKNIEDIESNHTLYDKFSRRQAGNLINFLQRMTALEPKKRPSLKQAQVFFKNLTQEVAQQKQFDGQQFAKNLGELERYAKKHRFTSNPVVKNRVRAADTLLRVLKDESMDDHLKLDCLNLFLKQDFITSHVSKFSRKEPRLQGIITNIFDDLQCKLRDKPNPQEEREVVLEQGALAEKPLSQEPQLAKIDHDISTPEEHYEDDTVDELLTAIVRGEEVRDYLKASPLEVPPVEPALVEAPSIQGTNNLDKKVEDIMDELFNLEHNFPLREDSTQLQSDEVKAKSDRLVEEIFEEYADPPSNRFKRRLEEIKANFHSEDDIEENYSAQNSPK